MVVKLFIKLLKQILNKKKIYEILTVTLLTIIDFE